MKKILALMLVTLMAFMVTACEPEEGETSTPDDGGGLTGEMITTESGQQIPEIILTQKDIEILLIGEPLEMIEGGAIYENLKKYYGGNIIMTSQSSDAIYTALATAVLSGDSPDIVAGHAGFPSVVLQEIVAPVDGLVDYDLEALQHLRGAYESYLFDGQHWMLPIDDIHTSAVFYNKAIFEENDMETPRELFLRGEWTWDKLREYALDLTLDEDGDGNPERWGLAMVGWHRGRFALTTGENLVRIEGDQIMSNLSSPNLERAYNFVFDLMFRDNVASTNSDMFFVHNALDIGEAAMIMSADFLALRPRFFPELKRNDNLGFVPYPKDPQADIHTAAGYANGFYLPLGSTNRAGSAAFIYAAAASLNDRYIPGQAMYITQMNENLNTIDGLTEETYARYVSWYNEYRQMPKITDSLNALIDPEDIITVAIEDGQLTGYQQAVAQIEPGLNELLAGLSN